MRIREFKNTDIDSIMRIWEESTIKAHYFIDESYWIENYNTVKEVYIPMSMTFVYEEDSKVQGFISIINNEFIGALFVDINSQGLGIGSKLIDFAIKKYKNLELAVYKDNKKAVEFYKNKGFKIITEQENEDSGYKEYIMKKE